MKVIKYLLLGAVFYAIFLAATVPTRWAFAQFVDPSQMQVRGAAGTIWTGSAEQLVLMRLQTAKQTPVILDNIRWDFQPSSLFTLSPTRSFLAKLGKAKVSGEIVQHGIQSFELVNTKGVIPSAQFKELFHAPPARSRQANEEPIAPDIRFNAKSLKISGQNLESGSISVKVKEPIPQQSFKANAEINDGIIAIRAERDPATSTRLDVEVDANNLQPSIKLQKIRFHTTANEIFELFPQARVQGVHFDLDLDLPKLELNPQRPMPISAITGTLLLSKTRLKGVNEHLIGDHSVSISIAGSSLKGRISSKSDSPLKLSGSVVIAPRGKDRYFWKLNIILDDSGLAPASRPFIQQLYSGFPKQRGQPNKRVINLQGMIPP